MRFLCVGPRKHAEGKSLDEMQAHRFLETIQETLTVQAMREKLRSTGAIQGQIRRVPLTHYLIMKFNINWHGTKAHAIHAHAKTDSSW